MTQESVEEIEALIVGGGQAGLAMSEHLSAHGIPHLVLERGRIAERWRSERWDSLVANGPAWHDRFPGMEYPGLRPRWVPVQGGDRRLLRPLRREDQRSDPLRRERDRGEAERHSGRAFASRPQTA